MEHPLCASIPCVPRLKPPALPTQCCRQDDLRSVCSSPEPYFLISVPGSQISGLWSGVHSSFAHSRFVLIADRNFMHRHTLVFSLALLTTFAPASLCFAQAARGTAAKRPMTFEDMMKMKRLGETAVSPDGKWLAYSVTTVNLEQNTKTAELFIQPVAGGDAKPLGTNPGDGGPQFAGGDAKP